jgi:rSAM/selenodomain-associated transferase 2/rSAM/selenodomain-associated transferase 1
LTKRVIGAFETLSQTERLIVFTRYPIPGKAKTRLIPALGAEGAASLQRQMTKHTLQQVRLWQVNGRDHVCPSVEIWFAGIDDPCLDAQRMQSWLGQEWIYRSQPSGDLGERMAQAFQKAFADGFGRVVVIGTDCPGLDAHRMAQAFQSLKDDDLVLGPATDGGYYLIGLCRFVPALFTGISWSTSAVFQQTLTIAEQCGLRVACLKPLTDIDRPEDLATWDRLRSESLPRFSVIIPVLNEANSIQTVLQNVKQSLNSTESNPNECCSHLDRSHWLEIIVVDGGSQDQTVELAKAAGATVLVCDPGRAAQMNAGAAIAKGEILVFLHADTRLPPGAFDLMWHTLETSNPEKPNAFEKTNEKTNIVAGAFQLQIDSSEPGLRWVERGVNWRSSQLQLPYGDQAIFLKAKTFHRLGGFPALPIMEDFVFVRQLQKIGKMAIVPAAVTTSARRWQKLGVIKTTLINQLIIIAYFLGVSPNRIARWYRSDQSRN